MALGIAVHCYWQTLLQRHQLALLVGLASTLCWRGTRLEQGHADNLPGTQCKGTRNHVHGQDTNRSAGRGTPLFQSIMSTAGKALLQKNKRHRNGWHTRRIAHSIQSVLCQSGTHRCKESMLGQCSLASPQFVHESRDCVANNTRDHHNTFTDSCMVVMVRAGRNLYIQSIQPQNNRAGSLQPFTTTTTTTTTSPATLPNDGRGRRRRRQQTLTANDVHTTSPNGNDATTQRRNNATTQQRTTTTTMSTKR